MLVDFAGCRSAVDQAFLQRFAAVWGDTFSEVYGNFYAEEPYLLAQVVTGKWCSYAVTEFPYLKEK
jgi:hypothetical protein